MRCPRRAPPAIALLSAVALVAGNVSSAKGQLPRREVQPAVQFLEIDLSLCRSTGSVCDDLPDAVPGSFDRDRAEVSRSPAKRALQERRIAYYGRWTRVDHDGFATITRFDDGVTYLLDLARHTYTRMRFARGAGLMPLPTRGRSLVDVEDRITRLGWLRIAGYRTYGIRHTRTTRPLRASGSCRYTSFGTKIITKFRVPALREPAGGAYDFLGNAYAPFVNASCDVEARHTNPKRRQAAFDDLVLYQRVELRNQKFPSGRVFRGSVIYVFERGNIRLLGPQDAALFLPPRGWRRDKP